MQPNGLPLQSLALDPAIDAHFLTVEPDTPLVDVLALMSRFRSCLLPDGDLARDADEVHVEITKIYCVGQEGETVFDLADAAGGCVLVIEESQLVGVFTERDIVRLTAAGISLGNVKIAEVMTQPPIILKQSSSHDIFTALGLFRQYRIRHLPIVDEQGQPVGIVTHDSIRKSLQPVNLLTRLRYVKDVMTTQVIQAPVTASVLQLAKLMTEHQVSCVVICEPLEELKVGRLNVESSNLPYPTPSENADASDVANASLTQTGSALQFGNTCGQQPSNLQPSNLQPSNLQPSNLQPSNLQPSNLQPSNLQPSNLQPSNLQPSNLPTFNLQPIGIVTERDIVQFQALELDLSRMLAQDVMSAPLFCLHSSAALWLAHEEMQRRHVRRIIVTGNQRELVGIVSQTSLLQVLNPADMYGVIEILQQAVEEQTSELKKTNEQLRHEIIERHRAEAALLQSQEQLKRQVEERTAQLTQANEQLKHDILERQRVEAALRQNEAQLKKQATQLKLTLQELNSYQTQLIQKEKMSALGLLVAGVAHEINNPINFIYGNITYATQYIQDVMQLLELYNQHYPQPVPEILEESQKVDLNFVKTDLPKLLSSMKLGADRIRDLVLSLRNFSRLDESEMKSVNLHEGLDSTLLILQNHLRATAGRSEITVIKDYGNLPLVECYAGQLNQVFMNLVSNSIDALEESRIINSQLGSGNSQHPVSSPSITIRTSIKEVRNEQKTHQSLALPTGSYVEYTPHAVIRIADNGPGIKEAVQQHLFDPFFTTKAVGKGTGLGLSISYQIVVKKHGGSIKCFSLPGQGTEFVIEIPIRQRNHLTGFALT